jgi:hypothetical protein
MLSTRINLSVLTFAKHASFPISNVATQNNTNTYVPQSTFVILSTYEPYVNTVIGPTLHR